MLGKMRFPRTLSVNFTLGGESRTVGEGTGNQRRNPYHLHHPPEPPRSPMDIVCICGTEAYQAGCGGRTQRANHAGCDRTYDVGMEYDFPNNVGGPRYQKIDPVLEVVEEISRETR